MQNEHGENKYFIKGWWEVNIEEDQRLEYMSEKRRPWKAKHYQLKSRVRNSLE